MQLVSTAGGLQYHPSQLCHQISFIQMKYAHHSRVCELQGYGSCQAVIGKRQPAF